MASLRSSGRHSHHRQTIRTSSPRRTFVNAGRAESDRARTSIARVRSSTLELPQASTERRQRHTGLKLRKNTSTNRTQNTPVAATDATAHLAALAVGSPSSRAAANESAPGAPPPTTALLSASDSFDGPCATIDPARNPMTGATARQKTRRDTRPTMRFVSTRRVLALSFICRSRTANRAVATARLRQTRIRSSRARMAVELTRAPPRRR